MTMERGTATQVMTGCHVYTSDGDHLGTVKEVQRTCFKVDAPMQPDYWLSTSCVATTGDDHVRLAFPKDQLGDYKLDGPNDKGRTYAGSTLREGDAHRDETNADGLAGVRTAIEANRTDPEREADHGRPYEPTTVGQISGFSGKDWNEAAPHYRKDWERGSGTGGGRWEDAEPGYRYGHEMAANTRFRGRSWDEVEPVLSGGWNDWYRKYGGRDEDGGWERVRPYTRAAWDRCQLT